MKEELERQVKEEEETTRMLETNMMGKTQSRTNLGKPPKMPEGAGLTMPTIMKQKRMQDSSSGLPGSKSMFGRLTAS